MKKLASLLTDKRLTDLCPPMNIIIHYIHYLQFKNAAAIAEGDDYVTSQRDERFTFHDSILTRSWSLLQNQI